MLATVVVIRWNDNMTQTPRVMPGERVFAMPPGVIPRGGSVIFPKEQRELAAKQPNPVKVSQESIALGKQRFETFCVPCHGAEAKGGITGPVGSCRGGLPTPVSTCAFLSIVTWNDA